MEGNINNKGYLQGRIKRDSSLTGDVKNKGTLNGNVKASSGTPPYTGEYDVVPCSNVCCLETRGKKMTDDLIIWAIPCEEVDNEKGGRTVTIGG